jgi:hypothetical protein
MKWIVGGLVLLLGVGLGMFICETQHQAAGRDAFKVFESLPTLPKWNGLVLWNSTPSATPKQ